MLTGRLKTGECLADLRDFGEPVSSCVWAADGQSFITGSFDKNRSMKMWDLRGNLLYAWENNHRTGDLALSRDQRWLVAMDERCTLHFYDFPTKGHVYDLTLDPRDSVLKASSVSISRDSRHLLVNLTDNEALLIDMETRETVQKYTGQKGGHFTIRSDFGGANENFVISGSEGKWPYKLVQHTYTPPFFFRGVCVCLPRDAVGALTLAPSQTVTSSSGIR